MLGPLGSTGPKTAGAAGAAGVGTLRHKPAASPRPLLRRGPSAHLAALFRLSSRRGGPTQSEWAEAIIGDGFATPSERMLLDAHRASTAFGPGMAAVFDLPLASGLHVEAEGPHALWVVALDAQDEVVAAQAIDPQRPWPVPDPVARLAVVCGRENANPAAAHWSRTSALLLIAPQVLLGEGVVLRTQAPLCVRHRRSTRARGVLSGDAVARMNRTVHQATVPGWTRTLVPGTAEVVVTLAHDQAQAADASGTALFVSALAARRGRAPQRLLPEAVRADGQRIHLHYRLVSDGPASCLVRPPPGYRHEGLHAMLRGQPLPWAQGSVAGGPTVVSLR